MPFEEWFHTHTLDRWLGIGTGLQVNLDETLVLLALLFLLHRLSMRAARRHIDHAQGQYAVRKAITYTLVTLTVITLALIWSDRFRAVGLLLGFLTLGLALALRTVIASAVAWVYIVSRQPFRIGDRVQVGGYVGHVVDIEVFHFVLVELKDWHGHALPTGRMVRVPNNLIFQTTVAGNVAGFPYHWDELVVQFAHGSDLESAKRLLGEVVARHAVDAATLDAELRRRIHTEFMMPAESLDPSPIVTIDPGGIKITVRYLSETTHDFAIEEAIWVDLLATVANNPKLTLVGIELPASQAAAAV